MKAASRSVAECFRNRKSIDHGRRGISNLISRYRARTLMNEALVFAWHTARWNRRTARLLLGMVPPVVEALRALTPHHLDAVFRVRADALRLRWQDDEAFWQRRVEGARGGSDEALADIHLHAKLLLSGG